VIAPVANTGGINQLGFYFGVTWREVAAATTTAQILTYIFDGTTGTIYRNGTSLGSGAYTPTAVGGTVLLGCNYTGSTGCFNGLLSEVVIYEGALSATQRQSVEAYLNGKYGIY
jgi:hypothetical protein